MRVRVDPRDYTPVHVQLAEILRGQIENGELAAGHWLPSEAALTQQHGVARETARQAIAQLRAEGLVVTVARVGTYVRGGGDVSVVTVEAGARVTARMPTRAERRTHDIPEGVPVLIVARGGRQDDVLPADRTVIHVAS